MKDMLSEMVDIEMELRQKRLAGVCVYKAEQIEAVKLFEPITLSYQAD
jgi:hypothetical protein